MAPGNGPWVILWRASIGLGIGILLTPPTLLLALISTGGGHGNYLWAKVLFPYSMVLPTWQGSEIGVPAIVWAGIQYPLYGVLIGASASSPRGAAGMAVIIGIVHVIAVAVCLMGRSSYFG
jgi:hypothetical protein